MKAWRQRSSSSGGANGGVSPPPPPPCTVHCIDVLFADGDNCVPQLDDVIGINFNDPTGFTVDGLAADHASGSDIDNFFNCGLAGATTPGAIIAYDGTGPLAGILCPFSLPTS